jgi:hypothetical protein
MSATQDTARDAAVPDSCSKFEFTILSLVFGVPLATIVIPAEAASEHRTMNDEHRISNPNLEHEPGTWNLEHGTVQL